MANSDNTIRGGLTSKQVALDVLLDILDFSAEVPPRVEAAVEAPGLLRYLTPAPEFTLWRLATRRPLHRSGRGVRRGCCW